MQRKEDIYMDDISKLLETMRSLEKYLSWAVLDNPRLRGEPLTGGLSEFWKYVDRTTN